LNDDQRRQRYKVARKRIITSLKGATATPKWMVFKIAGTLMQARIDYEKEMFGRGTAAEREMDEQDFGEFVEDRFVEMYGLKKVAHENLRDFIMGLKQASNQHIRLKVFRLLTGIIPGDDEANVSVSEGAATFYRLALRLIMETATEDHMSKLKGAAFWTHYAKPDIVKLPVLYFEKVSEKIAVFIKKLHSDAELCKTQAERTWTAKHEADAIRGNMAFLKTLAEHQSGKLLGADDVPPNEDGSKPKVFTYGDGGAGRVTASGGRAQGPISIDAFCLRLIEHWSEFEDLEEQQLLQAFGSWDVNGDGKLSLDEFSEMIKHANPNVAQRKITRAYQVAAAGGDHVDPQRLAPSLLHFGLALADKPSDIFKLEEQMSGQLTTDAQRDSPATARFTETAPTVARAMQQIGSMMHVISSMAKNGLTPSTEEEALGHALGHALVGKG